MASKKRTSKDVDQQDKAGVPVVSTKRKYNRTKETAGMVRERLEKELANKDARLKEAENFLIEVVKECKRLEVLVQSFKDQDQSLVCMSQLSQSQSQGYGMLKEEDVIRDDDQEQSSLGGGNLESLGFLGAQLSQRSQSQGYMQLDELDLGDLSQMSSNDALLKNAWDFLNSDTRGLEGSTSFEVNGLDLEGVSYDSAEEDEEADDGEQAGRRSDEAISSNGNGQAGHNCADAGGVASSVTVAAGASRVTVASWPGGPVPRVGIGCLVTHSQHPGRVLVGRRKGSYGAGMLALPGGHLEMFESWEEGAAREVVEETGLPLAEAHFVWVTNDPMPEVNKHYVTIFVQGEVDSSSSILEPATKEPDKCEGWQWIQWTALKDMAQAALSPVPDASSRPRGLFPPLQKLLLTEFNPIVPA